MVKDIVSQLISFVQAVIAIATDTTTFSNSFDTANFEEGIMFLINCSAYTDGSYQILVQESPDDSVWTNVIDEKYITDPLTIAAAQVATDAVPKVGVFSTKRYLRLAIVSTGTTSGASFIPTTVMKGELQPV